MDRLYFSFQGIAGLLWWIGVFSFAEVRRTTLGGLPLELGFLDIPLFVLGSFLAAFGLRWAASVVLCWTALVALGMLLYATITREAAWGMLLMATALGGTALATAHLLLGRIPTDWIIQGPFVFRTTTDTRGHLGRTIRQLVAFWTFFLVVLPLAIVLLEERWRLAVHFPLSVQVFGVFALLLASVLGIRASLTMARLGEGCPLPVAMAKRLVVAGPYRWIRNPMAVAGLGQGAAVGLTVGSWLVVVYALVGSVIWNWAVRPHEEADLAARFGDDFAAYREEVNCWIPKFTFPRPG